MGFGWKKLGKSSLKLDNNGGKWEQVCRLQGEKEREEVEEEDRG